MRSEQLAIGDSNQQLICATNRQAISDPSYEFDPLDLCNDAAKTASDF